MRIILVAVLVAACSIPTKFAGAGQDGGPIGGDIDGAAIDTGGAVDGSAHAPPVDGSAGSDGSSGSDGSGSDTPPIDAGIDAPVDAPIDAPIDAPTLVLAPGAYPPALGSAANVVFNYTVNDSALVECSLDGAAFAECDPPSKSYSGVADGAHTFDLRATAGMQMTAEPTYDFTVDTTPPLIAFTAAPAAGSWVRTTAATFEFTTGSDADPSQTTCQLGGGTAFPCAAGTVYNETATANATNTFTVRAQDYAGNKSAQTITWNVDTTAPSLALGTPPPSCGNDSTPTITWTVSDAGGSPSITTTCSVDGGAAVACSGGSYTPATALANGSHTISVTATDTAGNTTTRSTGSFIVSATASVSKPTGTADCSVDQITLSWTVTDLCPLSSATYSYAVDNNVSIGTTVRSETVGTPPSGVFDTFVITYTDSIGRTFSNNTKVGSCE